jgi:membrane-bound lytic murein transglycosylase D
VWLARVRTRPAPARAAELMPKLRAAFAAEGVPPELAWLAEAESSLNPAARSPVGAKGLFQFMPETARSLGLSTFLPDERTDPAKSARAAARYLRGLHGRFGNWALALAAYNAGEGRVARTLAARGAKTFTAIAEALPAETRMYVPKVCALIAVRAGVSPEKIAPPRG